ncbi:MAG: hypothetical protein JW829_05710 [Pirellulales bacterium]|nr:hypothetical protein [Pirellulales bacterium]
MAVTNRADLIARTHQVLKRHFKPVHPPKRSVFEHMLYACCLENSGHDAADEAFSKLRDQFIDWNEIRVSTTIELTEVMKGLSDPKDTAVRIKRILQGVFEATYSFDLESLTKENIGQAANKIRNLDGTTSFVVAYVIQQGLAGHAIPVNSGLIDAFRILGIISDSEAAKGTIPGLERAISKNNGIEVSSILHHLGVLFHQKPYSLAVRKLLLEIAPDCKNSLPKRPSKKPPEVNPPTQPESEAPAPPLPSPEAEPAIDQAKHPLPKVVAKKPAAKPVPQPPVTKKKAAKKPATKKPAAKKPATRKPAAKKSTVKKPVKKQSTAKKPGTHTSKKKVHTREKSQTTRKTTTRKSTTKQLSKRKPR